jgi:hypothetical protein
LALFVNSLRCVTSYLATLPCTVTAGLPSPSHRRKKVVGSSQEHEPCGDHGI